MLFSVGQLCVHGGVSRQAHYSWQDRQADGALEDQIVLALVQKHKCLMPNLGGRKVHYLLHEDLARLPFAYGRDRLFDLLRNNGLLVVKKRRKVLTTNSNHPFKIYKNLILDLDITHVFAVIVADITYIDTHEGFLFLALITDLFSRKIVGFDISDSLEMTGCLRALTMASQGLPTILRQPMPVTTPQYALNLIHHSDRGVQYCSNRYTQNLKELNFAISMAEAGNCYENAVAERVNGTLKNELGLGDGLVSKKWALEMTPKVIDLYNTKRPHWTLNLQKPQDVFQKNIDSLS